jgi:hypothetical protein
VLQRFGTENVFPDTAMFTNLAVLIGITASAVLGTGSNWLYDILKDKNVLPPNPSLKGAMVVLAISSPLLFLAALPQFVKHDENAIEQTRNQPPSVRQTMKNDIKGVEQRVILKTPPNSIDQAIENGVSNSKQEVVENSN